MEKIYTPYNITTDVTEGESGNYNVTVKWNQDLGFSDSFEDYEDFAQGSFGNWKSIDNDGMAVYMISYPTVIAPIVFNPYETTPAVDFDSYMLAQSGDKYVAFFSPQKAQADKWLISPKQVIRDGYIFRIAAKGYPMLGVFESIEFCISTADDEVGSFEVLDTEDELPTEHWGVYTIDLSEYAGQEVYLAVHYVSYDGYVASVDDFYVGPAEDGAAANVGNVLSYEVFLDGVSKGTTQTASFDLTGVTPGTHTVGIERGAL